ncbi:MAG: hypothetical protein ACI94Y_003812 [Maribacter sp.]|jgi:hypothetical protein
MKKGIILIFLEGLTLWILVQKVLKIRLKLHTV